MADGCGPVAIVVGELPPAMSISWERPRRPWDSGFVVFFDDGTDQTPSEPVCLRCLVNDADAQLARGLDLARRHGRVDFDVELGEWFVPEVDRA